MRRSCSAICPTPLRLGELQEAVRVIGRYPWFGVGYGASPDVDMFVGVSNSWLWIAERAGVLGGPRPRWASSRQRRCGRPGPSAGTRWRGPAWRGWRALLAASMVDHHVASFQHLAVLGGALLGATLVVVRRSA